MNVLLGVCDERVTDAAKSCFRDSKIGGLPDWPEKSMRAPVCDVSGKQMTLVVQVYCPLSGSPYHRTLYLFCCTSKLCMSQSHSWKVIRCQVLDEAYQASMEVTTKEAASDTWADDADDWVVDDDDDDDVHNALVTRHTEESCASNTQMPTSTEKVLTSKLQNVVLEEALETSIVKNGMEVVSHCISEDLPLPKLEDSILLSLEAHTSDVGACNADKVTFCSYYLSVLDEPEEVLSTTNHERELLKQYLAKEGKDLSNIASFISATEGSGETYEKASLKHGDRIFHKFQKRIARCPEQLLRYSYKGSPLHIRNNENTTPAVCSNCGCQRVFELQLMPALVNFLRCSPETDPVIEFGTVLVYTCEGSCWTNDAVWREELALVEADPYEDLFKFDLTHQQT